MLQGDVRGTANEPGLGEGHDHLVDGGRRDAEVTLDLGFRGRRRIATVLA
jgi:hypothetical protein